jgi:putative Holliday junction resolvase
MIVDSLEHFAAAIPRGQRALGLDLGTKTIGLSLSDVGLTVASPYETIRRRRFSEDAAALRDAIARQDVGGLVIGLPVEMDGREGPRCQSVRQFAKNLMAVVDLPVLFWDERLSTAAVQRMMTDEADLSRGRRAVLVDKLAAAYILQGALDALRNQRRS